jgi:mannose-6-phosphate isomerase class I
MTNAAPTDTTDLASILDQLMDETTGIIPLRPNYVRRYYRDGGRLVARTKDVSPSTKALGPWTPERWIASTVTAYNPDPLSDEGLSFIDIPGNNISLKDALSLRGEQILGPELAARYAPHFPLLSKVFDPYDPIVFHFHARDEDVQKFPEHFAPNSNGKEEAYYFLPRPKGRMPYTHVGLHPGVTRQELSHAIEKGSEYILNLSPAFAQRTGEGFHVPAGIPHRPGTALTLELQQPSDVYTHLDWFSGDQRLSPQQTHPGFDSLEAALEFIDWDNSVDTHILERYRLAPETIHETWQRGQGEETWIFPPRMTRNFSGKRVRVSGTFEMLETAPYGLLVWEGRGELNGRPIHAGDEAFVTYATARTPHVLKNTGGDTLEVFKFFSAQS